MFTDEGQLFLCSKKVGSTSGIDLHILVQLDFIDSKNYIF
jgi:hypothetical protein